MTTNAIQPFFSTFTKKILSHFWLPTINETKCLTPKKINGEQERRCNWFNTDIYSGKLANSWIRPFYPSLGDFFYEIAKTKDQQILMKKEEKKQKRIKKAKELAGKEKM